MLETLSILALNTPIYRTSDLLIFLMSQLPRLVKPFKVGH